jgi:hypothetical protein
MKKQTILVLIVVLAIIAFAEVIFIVMRSGDTIASNGNNTETAETDKEVTEMTTTAPREPEDDFSYTAPPGYQIDYYPNPDYNPDEPTDFSDSGDVIKIYSNDDIYEIDTFEYYPGLYYSSEFQYEYESLSEDDYADYLRELLEKNENAAPDEKIDLFLLKPEYAADFINSEYVIPLSELGITEAELSDQFEYAADLTSDDNGVQKGFMYKLYPEVFVYRRSVATAVLGTDDPVKVAEYVKDFETLEKTAQKVINSGYFMLGTYEEDINIFLGNDRMQNVYENGELIVPPSWKEWADHAKSYVDKGYAVPEYYLGDGWYERLESGNVFGYIGNSYYAEEYLADSFYDNYDDWAICPAPAAAYSEGVILCVAKGTDNPDFAAEIMRYMITDKEELRSTALGDNLLSNSVSVMNEIYEENGAADFLGGNETLKIYIDTANKIKNAKSDYSINSKIFDFYTYSLSDYLTGEKTYEQCLEGFLEKAAEFYPEEAKTIAQIEEEEDRSSHAITALYNAEAGATREELAEAKRIILARLETLGFEESECYVDYTTGEFEVTFYYPNDFEHASYVFEDIAKPTMEGSDETLNITIEKDTFWFNPLLY